MRNLLAFVAALLLSFVVVGWWLDWYRFRTSSADGKPSVIVDFNAQKIREDVKGAKAYIAKGFADHAARVEAEKKADAAKKAEEAKKVSERKIEEALKFH